MFETEKQLFFPTPSHQLFTPAANGVLTDIRKNALFNSPINLNKHQFSLWTSIDDAYSLKNCKYSWPLQLQSNTVPPISRLKVQPYTAKRKLLPSVECESRLPPVRNKSVMQVYISPADDRLNSSDSKTVQPQLWTNHSSLSIEQLKIHRDRIDKITKKLVFDHRKNVGPHVNRKFAIISTSMNVMPEPILSKAPITSISRNNQV